MTDGRSARTSAHVAVQNASDARAARTSAHVAVQNASDARAARTSLQVAVETDEFATTPTVTDSWGMIAIGI